MKKTLTLLTALCMLFWLTACDNGSKNPAETTVKTSEFTLSAEDAAVAINAQSNFSADESLEINLPDKIDYISKFTLGYPEADDNKTHYEEFMSVFSYVFPNKTIDRQYLLYAGKNSKMEISDETEEYTRYYNAVDDHFDDIMNGTEDVVYFFYKEDLYKIIGDEVGTGDEIFFSFVSPFGSGGRTNFNRGKALKLFGINPELGRFQSAEGFDPTYRFEYYDSYKPDSEEVFKLADKEISINDAVKVYEDFVNNIPMTAEENMEMKVIDVNVYKVKNGIYGYSFSTTRSYKNVPFDSIISGSIYSESNYDFVLGSAFMIESNEIDQVYGIYRNAVLSDEKQIEKILSFEDVCEKISSSLSSEVEFNVQSVDFVYCSEKMQGMNLKMSDYHQKTAPAWKFKMLNTNDGKTYVVYVDAENGENFRYYTY